MHGLVSEPLLELRAPLVRHLLQVAEPAPRLVPLTLLLELRGQLVLLDGTPLIISSRKIISVSDNNSDETKPRRYFFKSLRCVCSSSVCFVRVFGCVVVLVVCVLCV